jgi:SpoVK/Ycf46/Vps4 family AAA+-type ATPase
MDSSAAPRRGQSPSALQQIEAMNRIRVALGEVHSTMLRDILAHITNSQRDMELLGELPQERLKQAIAENKPDVLICDVRQEEFPRVCVELFSEPDPPIVVGLARDGREASVCIPNAGVAQLVSVIRSATSEADESKVVELARPPDANRAVEATDPYTSNSECLDDQLRCLDLALLAEVETFEATVWEEGTQRLQGLAVSPDEVRSLLEQVPETTMQRASGELRRRRTRLQEWTAKRIAASMGRPDRPRFVRLIEQFGLRPFEQFCVAATLALEIDRNKYGKAYALLQDDVTRKQPSFELFLRLWVATDDPGRSDVGGAFDTSRPLRRWNLLHLTAREATEPSAMFGRRVELDDRIARFLLGLEDLGPQLGEFAGAGLWEQESLLVPPPGALEARLIELVANIQDNVPAAPSRVVVHVHGRRGSGRRSLVAAVCQHRGLRLLRVDAARLVSLTAPALDDAMVALAREARLEPTAVCLENLDHLIEEDGPSAHALHTVAGVLGTFSPVSFVVGQRAWAPEGQFGEAVFHSVPVGLPDVASAHRIWFDELTDALLAPEVGGRARAATELASRFRLSPGQIHDAVAAAQTRALWHRPANSALTLHDLYRGCREQCSHRLGSLARQVTTEFGWDDLVLPQKQRSQLRELETAIRNAGGVLQDWNFESRLPYGRGINALFFGQSGTGKTMAAGILARELGLDLYKIDLSRVVSKYIGETEKNLDRIFQQAEDANAMLFFDEADALFGKRSAIKDAHDRYANIEVAYLLQKMEERLGVTILATNLKTNMDEAFVRRIRCWIEFPMPDYEERLQIWKRSMPREISLADDVDLALLAKRLRISGGSIMNVCVGAASLAYRPGGAIAMEHLAHAARRELEKLGHQYTASDFGQVDTSGGAVVHGRTRA